MIKDFLFKNWAESYSCTPFGYFEPKDEEDLRDILLEAKTTGKRVRIVGYGHSPSDICCTKDFMVSMKNFNKIISIDKGALTLEAEGGTSVEILIKELKNHDMALEMVPTVMHLTLAGMISTATHNTGHDYPVTSGFIVCMKLMKADGTTLTCSAEENSDLFYAAGAGLGSCGIIISLTMKCAPLYHLEMVQSSVKFESVIDKVKDIANASDHTRMYYIPHSDKMTIHQINRIKPSPAHHPYNWFWDHLVGFIFMQFAYLVSLLYTPLVRYINVFFQKLLYNHSFTVRNSYEQIFTFDIKFLQYVSEWSIPIENTKQALIKLRQLIESSSYPAHLPVEIRFVKGDKFFLSPAYGRDSTFMNIISYRPYGLEPKHQKYFTAFAEIMLSLNGRPHMAKDHPVTFESINKVFPKINEYQRIRKTMDPDNIFVNDYIERVLGF